MLGITSNTVKFEAGWKFDDWQSIDYRQHRPLPWLPGWGLSCCQWSVVKETSTAPNITMDFVWCDTSYIQDQLEYMYSAGYCYSSICTLYCTAMMYRVLYSLWHWLNDSDQNNIIINNNWLGQMTAWLLNDCIFNWCTAGPVHTHWSLVSFIKSTGKTAKVLKCAGSWICLVIDVKRCFNMNTSFRIVWLFINSAGKFFRL